MGVNKEQRSWSSGGAGGGISNIRKIIFSCALTCIIFSVAALRDHFIKDKTTIISADVSDLPTMRKLDKKRTKDGRNVTRTSHLKGGRSFDPPHSMPAVQSASSNASNKLRGPVSSKKGPEKYFPAVICASKECRAEVCLDQSVGNTTGFVNSTQLPDFLRPFPNAHYGYGFIKRKHPRGFRMQISGSAKSGSGCAISHKYKFIFVHVLKSGGTAVKGFLQTGLCGNNNIPCQTDPNNLQIVDCAASIVRYPHYFVFSFVRNPYSRMYSAYAMAHAYRDNPKNPKPTFSFEAFALGRDPNATKVTPSLPKNKFRNQLSYLHPSHYSPQTKYLFTSKKCPAVDYIGHLETMNEDLATVLERIGSPELWKYYEYRMSQKVQLKNDKSTAFGDTKRKKDLGDNLQTAYNYHSSADGQQPSSWTEIQKAVYEEYKQDFDMLGYDPNVVPI